MATLEMFVSAEGGLCEGEVGGGLALRLGGGFRHDTVHQ